jgi:TorA maturation chaperone TorD
VNTRTDAVNTDRTGVDGDYGRTEVYRLLGTLLASPPGNDVLALLRQIEPVEDSGGNAMTGAWRVLRDEAERVESEQIRAEYFSLFIGLGRGELVPYASWYLAGSLMERPLASIRARLRELAYCRQEGVREPEDHAAALCEVMGMIISDNCLSFDKQTGFFNDYIGSWMEAFFTELEQAELASFYRAVGRLGVAFMQLEKQYFSL